MSAFHLLLECHHQREIPVGTSLHPPQLVKLRPIKQRHVTTRPILASQCARTFAQSSGGFLRFDRAGADGLSAPVLEGRGAARLVRGGRMSVQLVMSRLEV